MQEQEKKLGAGTGKETWCIDIMKLPLALAKIEITKKLKQEMPELSEKLEKYQEDCADVLAAAFLPKYKENEIDLSLVDIPLGELASYLKIMDRVANRQNLASYKIAENFKKVSEQFGVQLSDDFVNVPEYVQQRLELEGGALS